MPIVLLVFLGSGLLGQSSYPPPRMPELPSPSKVEDLIPGVLKVLREIGIRSDSRVLVVSDSTVEPLVNEALFAGAQKLGAKAELILLHGYPEVKSSLQQIRIWGLNWWPEWVWDLAAREYQFIVSPSFLVHIHTSKGKMRMMPWFSQHNLKYLRVRESARKLAYQPWVQFPEELEMAIMEKVVDQLPRQRTRVHVTDPEGTDFTYDDDWSWFVEAWQRGERSINAGSLHVTGSPIQFMNARGVFVSRDLHLGPLSEPIKIYFEDSRITKIEGGGEFGEYVRSEIERWKDKTFVTTRGYGVPEPRLLEGIGWLEETAFMTHPKWIRVPDYGENSNAFSTAFNNWLSMGRSGVYHVAIGMSESTAWGPAVMPEGERDWHIDFLNYFVTLTIGDRIVIRDGRLTVLDDPEIRRIAARYGDPDRLLREDWIPAVPGVNVK